MSDNEKENRPPPRRPFILNTDDNNKMQDLVNAYQYVDEAIFKISIKKKNRRKLL